MKQAAEPLAANDAPSTSPTSTMASVARPRTPSGRGPLPLLSALATAAAGDRFGRRRRRPAHAENAPGADQGGLLELLAGARLLIERRLQSEEALARYYDRLVQELGGDRERIYSFDAVHVPYVWLDAGAETAPR